MKDKTPDITIEQLVKAVPKINKNSVTPAFLKEINELRNNIDYGEEFIENLTSHTNLLNGAGNRWSFKNYYNAVKYYSLMCGGGYTQLKAYAEVFPELVESNRLKGNLIENLLGNASRFNNSKLVNKIREQSMIPIYLLHQGTVHRAINVLLDIAENGRSEMARSSSASTLLKELKAPDTLQLEKEVGSGITNYLKSLAELSTNIANGQLTSLKNGDTTLEDIMDTDFTIKDIVNE